MYVSRTKYAWHLVRATELLAIIVEYNSSNFQSPDTYLLLQKMRNKNKGSFQIMSLTLSRTLDAKVKSMAIIFIQRNMIKHTGCHFHQVSPSFFVFTPFFFDVYISLFCLFPFFQINVFFFCCCFCLVWFFFFFNPFAVIKD